MKRFILCLSLLSFQSLAADARRFDVTDQADMTTLQCPIAVPNDGVSDFDTFQCVFDKLGANTNSCEESIGGVVHVPTGTFDFDKPMTIGCGTQLIGDGFKSTLNQLEVDWKNKSLLTLHSRTILRDLRFDQHQPEATPLIDHGPTIQCQGDDILVENIMLFKAYRGIAIGGLGFGNGRVTLRNIRGQPLLEGVSIDNVLDVVRIEDVHFWPFWSTAPDVQKFVGSVGTGIVTRRNDNPFFSNLFFIGYSIGLKFETSSWPNADISGSTSKAKVAHMDCDFCGVGILMDSVGASDNVVQSFSYLAHPEAWGWRIPLLVLGSENKLSVSEANVDRLPNSAVRVSGSDNFVRIGQWYVKRWNTDKNGSFAFSDSGTSNRLWVRESYGRWSNGGGACQATQSCEFTIGQNL